MIVGFPEPVVHAALIPDAFLTEDNIAMLEQFGTITRNLLVVDLSQAVQATLEDSDGNTYEVDLPQLTELE